MVTTERRSNPDEQYQNPAPIKLQGPMPSGVHDIEISWDRTEGYMRAIIEGQKWWFKELLGRAEIVSVTTKGRMNIKSKAVLVGEQLTLFRAANFQPHPKVKGVEYPSSYQRCCFRRNPPPGQDPDWRVRDERKTKLGDPDALVFVKGYAGDWNIEWPANDLVAHVYHVGPWILCDPGCFLHKDGGYAHFYET